LIRFGADEDLDNHIVRGLRHARPGTDVMRVQDAGLRGARDENVLAWAAETGRVLLSHDASTATVAAYTRIRDGAPMPGLIIISQWLPIGQTIEDLLLIADFSVPADWADRVGFLPLR
jgi:predicted nuclease of predicted toxin-antitoxin system